MQRASLMSILLITGACAADKPIDCDAIDIAKLNQCEAAHAKLSQAESIVACLPFSGPIKTSGIWVVGFEKNDFFEGPGEPPAEILWNKSTGADLLTNEEMRPKTVGSQIRAVRVEIVGRRALCAMAPVNAYPIAVEKLRVTKDFGTR